MREKCVQISFFNTYSDISDSMESNKPELVRLLEEYVDIDALIPFDFYRAYDRRTGRKRINSLESFIRAFIIQRLLGMKENKQLLTLLTFSKELRDYCGFIKLPDEAEASPSAKQQYINGHFCYAFKAGIVTNGLGIIRDISFFDDDFKAAHPEVISPKTDDPEKDKEIGDNAALKPILSDFFKVHKNLHYSTFLGDSAFDSYDTYAVLKNEFHFSRACIPLNSRNTGSAHGNFNEFGNPVCPKTGEQFICLGNSGGKNRSRRLKWVCPRSEPSGSSRCCTCDTPCTASSYGRCVYTYPEKNFRQCPGIARNTEHWDNLYRHRTLAERTINLFKEAFGLNYLKTQSSVSAKFDLYLAGCTQLIGVILAEAINKSSLFRSVRKIVDLVSCA